MNTITTRVVLAFAAIASASFPSPALSDELAKTPTLAILVPPDADTGLTQYAKTLKGILEQERLATVSTETSAPAVLHTPSLLVVGPDQIAARDSNNSYIEETKARPLAILARENFVMIVPRNTKFHSMPDALDLLRSDPTSVKWVVPAYIGKERQVLFDISRQAKVPFGDLNIAEYKTRDERDKLLNDQSAAAVGTLSDFRDAIEGKAVIALAITSHDRVPEIPIPTFREQGVDIESTSWIGLMVPQQTSPEDVKELDETIRKLTESEAWKNETRQRGQMNIFQPAQQFESFLDREKADGSLILDSNETKK
ncbi:tripartite tricarboxylate transporter substrate-binding protein [Rhizobium brockwellii]|uniref:tripartite tricarboxylate transporter substrate-binding protein n=1 Tax=Rhizobium brockwellii TaxID=3019932 RepID=UPI003F99565C